MLFVKIESLNFKFYKLLEFVNCHFSVYFHPTTIHIYIFNTLQNIFFISYIILDIKHIYKDRYQTV